MLLLVQSHHALSLFLRACLRYGSSITHTVQNNRWILPRVCRETRLALPTLFQ